MIHLKSNHPNEDPRRRMFSAVSCDLIKDQELYLPAELAAHICDCPIAAVSFHSGTVFLVKKERAGELGFNETSVQHFVVPTPESAPRVIYDLGIEKELNSVKYMNLPARIQFMVTLPILIESELVGSLTVMGTEKRNSFPETYRVALEKIAQQIGRLVNSHELQQQSNLSLADHNAELLQNELKRIAYKMHEDFAQTLAATKLYLEFAEDDQHANKHLLQISKETIDQVIQKMRNFYITIAPHSLETTF